MPKNFMPRARRAIELAIEESKRMHHSHVGTEHLLLGLLLEQEGVAAQILMNLGLKPASVCEEILVYWDTVKRRKRCLYLFSG